LATSQDPILQDLIARERSVVGKVEQARVDAQGLLSEAQKQALGLIESARREGEKLVSDMDAATEAEAAAARTAIVDAAVAEAERLTAQANAQRSAAVKLVLERVLP